MTLVFHWFSLDFIFIWIIYLLKWGVNSQHYSSLRYNTINNTMKVVLRQQSCGFKDEIRVDYLQDKCSNPCIISLAPLIMFNCYISYSYNKYNLESGRRSNYNLWYLHFLYIWGICYIKNIFVHLRF